MAVSLHKKILITSIAVSVISLGILIPCIILGIEETVIPALIIIFSLFSIITLYALRLKEKRWARRIAKYSIFAAILTLVPALLTGINSENPPGSFWILIVITIVFAIIYIIHLFLFTDAISISGVVALLVFILIGIFFKRMHWPLAGFIISFFSFLLSAGSFAFGLRCLFLAEGINYFRNTTFYGSCILSVMILGLVFKLQHWPGAGYLVIAGLIASILGTLYLLVTLSSSGYIDWSPLHKKIMRRILIPWIFFFFLMVSRFMVPELNTLIWTPEARKTERTVMQYGFGMKDYVIENKNGITEE
jgi:hypothetical protein